MEANKILQADVLDILFENRNKEYGAYELRRQYNKRMITALLATLAALILIFAVSFLAGQLEDTSTAAIEIRDVELVNIVEEEQKPEPPPPPPPKQEPPPKVEMTKFTPPKIVKDEEVKKEDIPPVVEELKETKIDLVSQEGIKDQGIAVPVVDEGKAVVVVKDETNYDQTFTKVEVEAAFEGDWSKYLTRTLNSSTPVDNGAPSGSYPVIVQFIVDKGGNISEVKALTSHGYGMEEEAIRVIKRGPKWKPAIQNGRQVKAYRKQPITFVVSDEG